MVKFFFLFANGKEHEVFCKRYMELYQELRENWERLYWDEGYSKKLAKDHANYDSAEEDDQDFNPYRYLNFFFFWCNLQINFCMILDWRSSIRMPIACVSGVAGNLMVVIKRGYELEWLKIVLGIGMAIWSSVLMEHFITFVLKCTFIWHEWILIAGPGFPEL